ncbi:MAG TPA: hypothetical protein PKY59_15750 [Pyrinomonadaceae bacterium]|nr:hypothetical protein [Pyrinomonadaceae bacterium]
MSTPIVLGIMISEAAIIVENSLRSVLGFDDDQLSKLDGDVKFEVLANSNQMRAILDFITNDTQGGLGSMSPPRLIQATDLNDISTGSTIRKLVQRLCKRAFFFKTPQNL